MHNVKYHVLGDIKGQLGNKSNYYYIFIQFCTIIIAFRAISGSFGHHYALEKSRIATPAKTW